MTMIETSHSLIIVVWLLVHPEHFFSRRKLEFQIQLSVKCFKSKQISNLNLKLILKSEELSQGLIDFLIFIYITSLVRVVKKINNIYNSRIFRMLLIEGNNRRCIYDGYIIRWFWNHPSGFWDQIYIKPCCVLRYSLI